MATTDVDICNLALSHVGQTEFITSLDDASTPAQILKAVYALRRNKVLEAVWWPFATKHALLAQLSFARSGWAGAYSLPTDCLVPQYIFNGNRRGAPLVSQSAVASPLLLTTTPLPLAGIGLRVPFTVEVSDDLKTPILLTDWGSPELVYTAALTTPGSWTPQFCEAFSYLLAEPLARSLLQKPSLGDQMRLLYKQEIASAWAAVNRELQEDVQPDSETIAVRQ